MQQNTKRIIISSSHRLPTTVSTLSTVMCGRAVQTVQAARGGRQVLLRTDTCTKQLQQDPKMGCDQDTSTEPTGHVSAETRDNFNMSPGMDALVFWKEDGEIQVGRKVWGLVTKGGTEKHPLPSTSGERMALHFGNLMYNSRTDTLFSKPTFSKLLAQQRSCIVALDGYFEWKTSLTAGKGKKQPYFVHRKEETPETGSSGEGKAPLILAGLWNRVPTGLKDQPILETFSILTTEASQQIEWLHHRMPVCIWDDALAQQWLNNPTKSVHKAIDESAKGNTGLAWHMVTTEMSSMKFRSKKSIQKIAGPRSVASFFSSQSSGKSVTSIDKEETKFLKTTGMTTHHHTADSPTKPQKIPSKHQASPLRPSPTKKRKADTSKKCITAFFAPKK